MSDPQHLGGDKWRVRAYVGTNPLTGKPRRRSITFHANGIKAARKAARKHYDALDAEREGLAASGSIAELVDDWLALAERDRSQSTLRKSYRPRAALIRERFGTVQAVNITESDIDRWYTALMSTPRVVRKGRPPVAVTAAGVLEIHRVFSAILNFGVKKRRIPQAVTEFVTLPEYVQADIDPPTPAVVRAVWDALPDVPWGRAVRLLSATGMRRGEVVGLKWEDWDGATIKVQRSIIELKGGGIHVGPTKGRRNRTVTLGRIGQEVLETQRLASRNEWVFSTDGGPARPGWISTMWNRWRDTHGAAGVRPHDLRHFYATYALEMGAPLASVSAQLGHAQTSTTLNLYAAKTDTGRQMAADAIDKALGR